MAVMDRRVSGRRPSNKQRVLRSGHHSSTGGHLAGNWMMKLSLCLIVVMMLRVSQCCPCTYRMIRKGLDVVCDHVSESDVLSCLGELRERGDPIYWMKLRYSNLQRLQNYMFLGLEVQHLNIIRGNVTSLEEFSLSDLGNKLESLDLATNNIDDVPTVALSPLKALKFLNLNYNKIRVLNDTVFGGLIALERLTLYENEIAVVHENAFRDISSTLLRLNLGKNWLGNIPTHALHPLTKLEVLDLHENRISHLSENAFRGLHNLDMLKLEHNSILIIADNAFLDLRLLSALNIEYNHMVNVSSRAFAGLESNLQWLELGHNILDHIPADALRPLQNLRQVSLNSNRIKEIKDNDFSGYGPTIKYLQLDMNSIESIPTGTFDELHSLEWLTLSGNNIETLTRETITPVLDTLVSIDLANNPLKCDCELEWFRLWMNDPINRRESAFDTEPTCVTENRETRFIKDLSEEQLQCSLDLAGQVKSPNSADVIRCSSILTLMAIVSTFL